MCGSRFRAGRELLGALLLSEQLLEGRVVAQAGELDVVCDLFARGKALIQRHTEILEGARGFAGAETACCGEDSRVCASMLMGTVFGVRSLTICRISATCALNSAVRAGASPRQKGTLGGAP